MESKFYGLIYTISMSSSKLNFCVNLYCVNVSALRIKLEKLNLWTTLSSLVLILLLNETAIYHTNLVVFINHLNFDQSFARK